MAWGAQRVSNLKQSDIREMTRECLRVEAINLGQGLCETPTPPEVIKASVDALKSKDKNMYSLPEGILALRQKIAEKLQRENHIEADPNENIIVSAGATGGYATALMSLFDPGDGILLFEPYYGYHVNAAMMAGIEPQYVAFPGPGLQLIAKDIEAAIQPNTKAIIICTPGNPSGKMWTESDIRLVGDIAKKHNLLILTDEMYEYFRYGGRKHISPASFSEYADRTITMMGMSKTFSITGWRLGYVVAPTEIAKTLRLANDLFYVCAPTPLQFGVAAGFDLGEAYYQSLQDDFQVKRDKLCEAFSQAGMNPIVPQGAYYVLADISNFKAPNSKVFAMSLLESAKVSTIPGRAFFQNPIGENYIRANFAVNDDVLDEACKRIAHFKGAF